VFLVTLFVGKTTAILVLAIDIVAFAFAVSFAVKRLSSFGAIAFAASNGRE
jgi:hypothetical protein